MNTGTLLLMKTSDRNAFCRGFKHAFPVFISYFMVSLAIGINASDAGFSPVQAAVLSLLNLTSAGQAAGIEIIKQHGTYAEIILSQVAINLRYLLMAAALTIKLSPDEGIFRRLLMSLGITDENFALTAMQKNPVSPLYTFGCYCISMPGWVIGTYIGATAGNIFPPRITLALSIALYAMFCAIILTPAKSNPVLLVLVLVSMLFSWIFTRFIVSVSFGMRVIILTVVLAGAAAWLFPVKEEENA